MSKKLRAASFSIIVNIFLISMKAVVSVITGSLAILAELAHSIFDMVASVFAYLGIKKAEEPADETHLYGHEKFENLSSFAQTILIAVTSVLIIYEAFNRIAAPKKIEASEIGLIVMLVTIGIDYFISKYLHRTSREEGSAALEADAYHFTTDLWGALAVIVGLVFVLLGFPIFDSIAAIAVAILMLWISYKLGKGSINVLMDRSPSADVMERIGQIISGTHGVKGFHKLRARYAGSKIIVEVHIQVALSMHIDRAHEVAHNVKKRLLKEVPQIKLVTIHIEPRNRK
ncbi:MAG: cation transporter [Candidatus Aenigmarchaeota archaeon]|nr:cation transporter [Candidatus Aenigmarchaeota archaeon]